MALTGWHTRESMGSAWQDLPAGALGDDLLESSKNQCIAHLKAQGLDVPAGTEGDPVPSDYRVAQLAQAKATWRALKARQDGEGVGDVDNTIRVYPMGKPIKDLLGYGDLGIG